MEFLPRQGSVLSWVWGFVFTAFENTKHRVIPDEMSNIEFYTLKKFSLTSSNHSKSPADYPCAAQKSN